MTDKPFQSGYLLLVDQNISNVHHLKEKSYFSVVSFQVNNKGTITTNSQPLKILLKKRKSKDLTENTF